MPSLDSPCFLLPHGTTKSSVYVCIPVDARIAQRSTVVETLMEYEGLVQMPAGVTFEDFEAWSAIPTDDPAQLDNDQLSFALQVGDKLSANDTGTLAKALADRLKNMKWRPGEPGRSILRALLPMSRNLQQLVFSATGSLPPSTLLSWPIELQQAYADTWVSHGKRTFSISEKESADCARGLLSMLPRTDPALPRLGSLTLSCPIPTTTTATLVCDALTHHTSLSHLELHRLSWFPGSYTSPAAKVFRTLPRLTALTALTLSCCTTTQAKNMVPLFMDAASDCIHALAAAIRSLPTLASFHLYNQLQSDPLDACRPADNAAKRPKIASCLGPGDMQAAHLSLDPVIAALSTAPALTALCFTYTIARPTDEMPCSGLLGAFARLRELTLEVRHDQQRHSDVLCTLCPTSSLLHIAPLPALTRLSLWLSGGGGAFIEGFLSSSAEQPALRAVDVTFAEDMLSNGFHRSTVTADEELQVEFPAGTTFMLGLHEPVSMEAMLALAAGLPHLWGVRGICVEVGGYAGLEYFPDASAEDVSTMMQPLGVLTQLQELVIYGGSCSIDTAATDALSRGVVAGSLQCLSQLTELSLEFDDGGLPASQLARSLQALTGLCVVHVSGVKLQAPSELRPCIEHLSAL